MNDRQMLEETLKDIEEMDHKLDEIRRRATPIDSPEPAYVGFIVVKQEPLDELARYLVEVKRTLNKHLAGA